MTYENILTKNENGILTITINRPDKLNALNIKTIAEINLAMIEAQHDASVKVIIITGSGEKAFVAGADISEFSKLNVLEGSDMARSGQVVFNAIENCGKPVIAAVNGFALGGGCELAMACHIRVASENAKFGQPEVNLGLIPGYGGTQRLTRLVGKGKAIELLITADMINAPDALTWGLVNYVVKQEDLMAKCFEIANKTMNKAPLAIAACIECANAANDDSTAGFEKEIEEFGECFGTEDMKEGVTAFMEKRKAVFTGK